MARTSIRSKGAWVGGQHKRRSRSELIAPGPSASMFDMEGFTIGVSPAGFGVRLKKPSQAHKVSLGPLMSPKNSPCNLMLLGACQYFGSLEVQGSTAQDHSLNFSAGLAC